MSQSSVPAHNLRVWNNCPPISSSPLTKVALVALTILLIASAIIILVIGHQHLSPIFSVARNRIIAATVFGGAALFTSGLTGIAFLRKKGEEVGPNGMKISSVTKLYSEDEAHKKFNDLQKTIDGLPVEIYELEGRERNLISGTTYERLSQENQTTYNTIKQALKKKKSELTTAIQNLENLLKQMTLASINKSDNKGEACFNLLKMITDWLCAIDTEIKKPLYGEVEKIIFTDELSDANKIFINDKQFFSGRFLKKCDSYFENKNLEEISQEISAQLSKSLFLNLSSKPSSFSSHFVKTIALNISNYERVILHAKLSKVE